MNTDAYVSKDVLSFLLERFNWHMSKKYNGCWSHLLFYKIFPDKYGYANIIAALSDNTLYVPEKDDESKKHDIWFLYTKNLFPISLCEERLEDVSYEACNEAILRKILEVAKDDDVSIGGSIFLKKGTVLEQLLVEMDMGYHERC